MRLTGMNPSSVSARSCQEVFFSLHFFRFCSLSLCVNLIGICTHPAWKSPKGECRMTTHHSGWCTGYGRCFLVPSISKAGRSVENWKTLFECVDFIIYLCIRYNFWHWSGQHLRCLSRCSWSHAWCLWPGQSHRSSQVCPHRSTHFLPRGLDGRTAERLSWILFPHLRLHAVHAARPRSW